MRAYFAVILFLTLGIVLWPNFVDCRKHHLELTNDGRNIIQISTFGFLKEGFLSVKLNKLIVKPESNLNSGRGLIGFTVDQTLSDGLNPYSQNIDSSYCALSDTSTKENGQPLTRLVLIFDFKNKLVRVNCSKGMEKLQIHQNVSELPFALSLLRSTRPRVIGGMVVQRNRRSVIKRQEDEVPMPLPNQFDGVVGSPKPEPVASPVQSHPDTKLEGESGGQIGVDAEKSGNVDTPNQKVVIDSQAKGEVTPKSKPSPAYPSDDVAPNQGNQNQQYSGNQDVGNEDFQDPGLGTSNSYGGNTCENFKLPLVSKNEAEGVSYSTSFVVYVPTEELEGLYNLYFHNCLSYDTTIDLDINIVEENQGKNFLSAGEMPLPALYFMMSIIFFISGCFWVFILRKSKRESGVAVFKIHYLMGALVFLKSLSLLFHSINYHYIQTEGIHVEGFAVLYYTVHLLKGALLFITILLIGTGYAFVKHLLSDKDKKIFMVVIPLQVLANVAEIIIEESEEGEIAHTTWKVIFIAVDLLCCMAILFPVVWSIRHLQEASSTDGKAATNLRKLKLFRHFYIIVVCYIYFTRIIVNLLLKITVPFQYEWLDNMLLELTTFMFFVLTGYKFRPAPNNPYLELAHDSDDETEMDVALTESGLTAGVSKRGSRAKKKTLKEIVYFDDDTDDDEEVLLEKTRDRETNQDFL